jgi:hypothetical protein
MTGETKIGEAGRFFFFLLRWFYSRGTESYHPSPCPSWKWIDQERDGFRRKLSGATGTNKVSLLKGGKSDENFSEVFWLVPTSFFPNWGGEVARHWWGGRSKADRGGVMMIVPAPHTQAAAAAAAAAVKIIPKANLK